MSDKPASSDADLVQQVLDGDIDSFGILVSRYERLARAVVLRFREHALYCPKIGHFGYG